MRGWCAPPNEGDKDYEQWKADPESVWIDFDLTALENAKK